MSTATITEAEFQLQVTELADILGWRFMHVRRSIGKGARWTTATNVVGWCDLFMWHPEHARVIAVELKSEMGKPTPEQVSVLDSLRAAGLETYVWRPSDFDHLQAVLTARTRPTPETP